jgi:hypothetical protein
VTTRSESEPAYVSRDEAARLFEGSSNHIYQGDIFQSLELFVPRPGGTFDTPISHAIVVSHDCEYTKIVGKSNKPLLIAPLRELRVYQQADAILEGRAVGLWALPEENPIDDAYVADLRMIQPFPVGDLVEAQLWTCLGVEAKKVLQARIARFFLRAEPK